MAKDKPRPPPTERRSSSRRDRSFFLVTYANEESILDVFEKKKTQIKAYAYCHHDKDKNREPHTHILIRTHEAVYLTTVLNWFKGCIDDNGDSVNTHGEFADDFGYCFRYLIHGNKADKHKFQYSNELRKVSDNSYFTKYAIEPNIYRDSLKEALISLALGQKTVEACVIEYGRDFIIHYKSIKEVLEVCDANVFLSLKGE